MADFLNQMFDYSTSNIHGGQNFFGSDGQQLGFSTENIFGGEDIHNQFGQKVGQTMENIFGGQDLLNEFGQKVGFTMDNGLGGESLFNESYQKMGDFVQSIHSIDYQSLTGNIISFQENILGGINVDPLVNMSSVSFPNIV